MKKSRSNFVLVTGVSSGIGLGIARAFARHGYTVFGSVRKETDAKQLSGELGARFHPLVFDVTDIAAIARAAKAVTERIGAEGLGCLINNAGVAIGGPLMHQPVEVIRSHFEVNVIGMLSVTKAFLPLLGARSDRSCKPGKIINIGSVGGKIASPYLGAYAGSKFAVEGISDTLRRELLLYGIDVIVIEPGAVNTPIWDKGVNAELYRHTDYYNSITGFVTYFVNQGKRGFTIDYMGERIVGIFETPKPKARYAIVPKRFSNWTIPRLLPVRMLDRIIGRSAGLIRKNN
jgi:NAD(P)-dependent dehydrogenase (short-subunit alcohol dehydrogenase family)